MNIEYADSPAIEHAARLLRAGKLVAFATETVYGLGADATNDAAVAEIYALKGRPEFNPLIIHLNDVPMAKRYVAWNNAAEILAASFWPGPLTLILPRLISSSISHLASAGGDTLGIRIPAHPIARALLACANIPIAAPSANRSGRVSPTSAEHVYAELGNTVSLILDGGLCEVGIESTVVDVSSGEAAMLRPGFITQEEIENALGTKLNTGTAGDKLKSPGQLLSHYAPTLPLRLEVKKPRSNEALIAFGSNVPEGAKQTINLSAQGNLKEAAANLFATLRMLDNAEYASIAVMPIPRHGLGLAINDRLMRASFGR